MFHCGFSVCLYQSQSFNRILNHVWDRHSLERGIKYDCGMSGCPRTFSNQQSFHHHVKHKHSWFYGNHMFYFKNKTRLSVNANEQENGTEGEHDAADVDADYGIEDCSMIDDNDVDEDFVELLDYDTIIGEFLLELHENFNVSIKAMCFVSAKIFHLLSIDRKQLYTKLSNVQLDYEPKAILFSESQFQLTCKKISSEKALSQFIKQTEILLNL